MEVRKKIAALTQEELAEAMEVSRQTVYKWEHDLANPELSKLEKLIKTLNISFDDLLK
ncbi:MAG: helix-turn-helix domain-containing protein [Anaeroplasmataceae bacterium]|nr:helix-turn-helix domain-containing protein [Anaeroplasmataceae bacterium]